MWQLISTTVFSILVTTSSLFILMTALPIFIQLALGRDVNVRIWDVVLIGLPYFVTSAAFFVCWLQRRYILSLRMERIPRHYIVLKEDDLPTPVHDLITKEYQRVSAIAYISQPEPSTGFQPGWGRPGTEYEDIYFRRAFLDAVEDLDNTARQLLPSLPKWRTYTRLVSHFRPLLVVIPAGSSALQIIDTVAQIAVFGGDDRELLEEEFVQGYRAVNELNRVFQKELDLTSSERSSYLSPNQSHTHLSDDEEEDIEGLDEESGHSFLTANG